MARYAIVQSGVVANVVNWDGGAGWSPPAGSTPVLLTATQTVQVGDTYNGSVFSPGTPPAPEPFAGQVAQALVDLQQIIDSVDAATVAQHKTATKNTAQILKGLLNRLRKHNIVD
jgi:hypothetical protein